VLCEVVRDSREHRHLRVDVGDGAGEPLLVELALDMAPRCARSSDSVTERSRPTCSETESASGASSRCALVIRAGRTARPIRPEM
jgi:hypothetical protein